MSSAPPRGDKAPQQVPRPAGAAVGSLGSADVTSGSAAVSEQTELAGRPGDAMAAPAHDSTTSHGEAAGPLSTAWKVKAETPAVPQMAGAVNAKLGQIQRATGDASRLMPPPATAEDRLKRAAESFHGVPSILKRIKKGSQEELELQSVAVLDWYTIKEAKGDGNRRLSFDSTGRYVDSVGLRQAVHKVTKVSKQKGRTYTSKYRGVHQTFPTRRWEAQFRRNGKPTSLGCFDKEEEAAKAYDKMMIWCELHQSASVKGGITNFDVTEYEDDMTMLQSIEQDDLVMMLRRDGRAQAAQGTMATKAANLRHTSRRSSDSGTQSEGEHVDSRAKDLPQLPSLTPMRASSPSAA